MAACDGSQAAATKGGPTNSITPRCLRLAFTVAEQSQTIAQSLGLVPPPPSSAMDVPPSQPTLLTTLREIETALEFTMNRLGLIGQHING